MSLSGANILITGATSGLGLAVSKRFARLGANTVVVGRTAPSAAAAVAAIRREVPDASLEPMACDLASMASVDRLLADVGARFETIDLLFDNAAVMKRERTLTEDGFETMFPVNFLAPFVLMTSLLDRVQASTRIHMAEPGSFTSELVREAPWLVGWIKNRFSASVDDAADHIVHVVGSDAARAGTGKVFTKRDEFASMPYWQDADVRSRLWTTTEAMIERSRSAARR